jgi:hypothetical protein
MRDHHDIPFAMPLMMAAFFAGILGFIIVKYINIEQKKDARDYSLIFSKTLIFVSVIPSAG